MNQKELIQYVEVNYKRGVDLIKIKNNDYAKPDTDAFANFRAAEAIGIKPEKAILLRVLDKIARINNCMEKDILAVETETIEDTVIDCSNYLQILAALLQDNKKNKTK